MARSKRISAYSPDMVQVAMRSGPRPIRLSFPDKKAAEAMRLNFYGLRGAISTEGGGEQGGMFSGFMDSQLTIRPGRKNDWELCIAPPEFQDDQAQAALKAALTMLDDEPMADSNPSLPLDLMSAWTPPPPPVDPYEAYLRTPEAPAPAPPVDPFDLTETRDKVDSFTTAVTAWLGGGESPK